MVEAAEEAKEEDTDKAEVQAVVEAEEGEDHKSNHSSRISIKLVNSHRHIQRPKRDRKEAVSTARATTTSVSALNSL